MLPLLIKFPTPLSPHLPWKGPLCRRKHPSISSDHLNLTMAWAWLKETSMGEIGRFNEEQQLPPKFHGNSVSLTLGLPHCENLSLSRNPQNFLSNHNIQLGINTPHASHSNAAGFDNIHEMQNRQRFAAQLLPDFVA